MATEENAVLSLGFDAGGVIPVHGIVKLSADDAVVVATAATDEIIGVLMGNKAAADGDRVDVMLCGVAICESAGTIARGIKVTAGAAGQLVAVAESGGGPINILGVLLKTAADGDYAPVLLKQSLNTII